MDKQYIGKRIGYSPNGTWGMSYNYRLEPGFSKSQVIEMVNTGKADVRVVQPATSANYNTEICEIYAR